MGGKGRAGDKEKEKGSSKSAKQSRGGAGRGRGRGRKGQDGWRKKGEYAKKEDLLHQMKWPKTRRKALTTMWESDLVLKPGEYSALLTAACQLGWAAMASTIMEEMVASDVPVTTTTYDAAIKAACKANKDRLALLLIVDQYARWQAKKQEEKAASQVEGIGEDGKAAVAAGRRGGKGLSKSYFRTNLGKVLQVTSRTGDVEGSLEVLKYMSAMGISANPAMCQHLLATACKAGRGNAARVPLILRAMGECGLRPDVSLLESLEMLFEANSPEVALDLLLDVARVGREKKGIGKIWRFHHNAGAAEAFSYVLQRAEKMGRSDVVDMTIQALLSDLPKAPLYSGQTGREPAVAAAPGPAGGMASGREDPAAENEDDEDEDGEEEDEEDEEDEEEEEEEEEEWEGDGDSNFDGIAVAVGNNTVGDAGAAGSGGVGSGRGGEWASKLSSAVSGALTGTRAGKGQQEGSGGAGGSAGGAGTAGSGAQQKSQWSRLGQKELNRQRRSEAIYRQKEGVSVLNHILGDLANSSNSGHTAAGVLDRWRSLTLGGGWAEWESGGAGEGGAVTEEVLRYSRPTEASYMHTMSALVQSGQWGRARSLLEVMRADGIPPTVRCHSHLLKLLHARLASRLPDASADHQEEETALSSLSPLSPGEEDFLWSEPTYEWDEVVSLIRDSRSAEAGVAEGDGGVGGGRGGGGVGGREYEVVTDDMYHTALDVLQIVSQRPEHVSLGVVGSAVTPLPPPPAKVFLERAECLLEWALDADMGMSVEFLLPVLTLSHTARDAKKVFKYFEEMLELDIPRQGWAYSATFAEAYNMAIHACEFGAEPERALAYVRTMGSASGLKPRAQQYEAAIKAMVAARRYRDAYQLLAEAVENGAEKLGVYDAAMKACAMEGNPAQAETLVRIMLEMGLNPGSEAMSQLLLAYGNSGDVEGIQSVMTRAGNEVFTRGVMNALVYESVLRVLAPLEAWQDAEMFVKEGEMILPGSLTYRTYGYLMVAYAVEKQWGAAIELALGTGRWPEKTSGGPEGRSHPPELRETTCAVALKWFLTQGVDGLESVASGGSRDENEGGGGGGGPRGGSGGEGRGVGEQQRAEEAMAERALEYRKCGRELFTRLLASGAPLRSIRVIKAALGGIGAEPGRSPTSPDEGSEDAPVYWKQTMPFWGDPEKPSSSPSPSPSSSGTAASSSSSSALASDWLLSVLPEEEAEREAAAQALHVGTVVEVFLRLYSTCDQPGSNGFHSPAAVGLMQQAISAACLADDPDLADRLFTAWLDRARVSQLSQARLRSALRISLSEVLAAFFAEGQGEEGVYRGLSLIGRCRDAGLSPYPFDFLGAMRACNTAGLYSTALRLFDQLTPLSSGYNYPGEGEEGHPDGGYAIADTASGFDSDPGMGRVKTPSEDSEPRLQQQQQQELQEPQETQQAGDRHDKEMEDVAAGGGSPVVAGERLAEGAADGVSANRGDESGAGNSDGDGRGRDQAGAAAGERAGEGAPSMAFENLNDIPDGELIPAAAATIALESCFLGGRRDQAMEIVWQLIRLRHPLTEACRNRAIVALTSGGHPDMALDMARGMEKDQHYADRATVEFVERFQKRAFEAAEAYELARQGDEEDDEDDGEEEEDEEEEGVNEDDEDDDWEEDIEEEDEVEDGDDDLVLSRLSSLPSASSVPDDGSSGGGGIGNRPSELILRFLPLLSEALRSKLRPGDDEPTPEVGAEIEEGEQETVDENALL